jgi:hypothetical protein
VDIHGTGDAVTTSKDSNKDTSDSHTAATDTSVPPRTSQHYDTDEDDNDGPSVEEKITDPYDPYVPNDLLEYWETLAAKKHREKLEQETRDALDRQKLVRKQLEEDRERALLNKDAMPPAGRGRGVTNMPAWMAERQRQGDSLGTGGAAQPAGRGRGRGVSNLPAWLVEKQRKEATNGQ